MLKISQRVRKGFVGELLQGLLGREMSILIPPSPQAGVIQVKSQPGSRTLSPLNQQASSLGLRPIEL